MQITPDAISAAVALLGLVGSFLAFLGAFIWRLSGRVQEVLSTQTALTQEMAKLRAIIAQSARQATGAIDALSRQSNATERNIAILTTSLGEREKDIGKLEGKMEQAHDDLLKVVASLSQVMGSLDQVWKTLTRLHPTEVPRRASERG